MNAQAEQMRVFVQELAALVGNSGAESQEGKERLAYKADRVILDVHPSFRPPEVVSKPDNVNGSENVCGGAPSDQAGTGNCARGFRFESFSATEG